MATFTAVSGKVKARVRKPHWPNVSRTFSTNAAARAWARETERAMDAGTWVSRPVRHTVKSDNEEMSSILRRFCSEIHALKPFGDSKMSTTLAAARRLEGMSIHDLDAAFWVNYARDRRGLGSVSDPNYQPTPGRTAKTVGAKTINDELGYIRQAIDFAMTLWGLELPYNPVDKALKVTAALSLTGASKNRTRRPTSRELRLILENAVYYGAERRLHCLSLYVRLAICTGMRLSEMHNLEKSDIDFDREEFWVRDRKHPTLKRGNDYLIDMRPEMKEVMLSFPESSDEYFISRHTVTTADSISTRFTRLVKKLGIKDLTFHDLRHEAISRFFEDTDMTATEIMAISGHLDRTQLARYTQLRTRAQRRDERDKPSLVVDSVTVAS
jgi:integrase